MSNTKALILEAASQLFYRQGIGATNIEDILSVAGVARQSLYTHFGSKDGLVLAFLEKRDMVWRSWCSDYINAFAGSPKEQLLALFDFLAHWFESGQFRGCAFINTAVEFPSPEHPYHAQSKRHLDLVKNMIKQRCEAAQISNAELIATKWLLLMEGAIVMEQLLPKQGAVNLAKSMAIRLMETTE